MSVEKDSKKRLFIGLITGTCGLLCLFFAMLWYVPYVGLSSFGAWASWTLGLIVLALILTVGWAYAGLLANVVLGRTFPFSQKARGLTVKLFLPLMTILGRLFGLSKRKIRSSFIKVNNELVLSETGKYDPEKIMILTPHCLQNSRCDMRLTYDVDNCKRCGLCTIKGLLDLRDKYGSHFAVATGGTIARRLVVQKRPRLIIAIACERDLASGIQDTYPLPVFGVLNERPHGPCLDTEVSLLAVEEALRRFIKEDRLPEDADKNVAMTPITGL
ncbi:DUF116 domain-containing protein [Maridesulfovibrio hydrothermalis]|uniref:DUF116 domain-containing protein n=1 Tax=Maridesulfovibrio hydrothermalis AM13 = DSM 14728 TaxID=1121451 RepID=L0R7Z3_9BACT|nr:DUF116 domain-containing protein [Maridesulfovibrio hydrothermalis]CCO22858.1 conserved membrane protein of unknown function [Maridesulfovibrio hydrothermalis AM13 = DSM 14728]